MTTYWDPLYYRTGERCEVGDEVVVGDGIGRLARVISRSGSLLSVDFPDFGPYLIDPLNWDVAFVKRGR